MPQLIPFLSSDIAPTSIEFFLDRRSTGGGQTLTGGEQVIGFASAQWRATLAGLSVRKPEHVREYRRFISAMEGRLNTTYVPFYGAQLTAPWPTDAYGRTIDPAFIRARTLDGTIFEDAPTVVSSLIDATLVGNAVEGQSNINVQMAAVTITVAGTSLLLTPSMPQGGQIFSVRNRAYMIRSVTSTSSTVANVWFSPPLRSAEFAGTALDFVTPNCEMRLISDESGRVPLELFRFGAPSLEFVEV